MSKTTWGQELTEGNLPQLAPRPPRKKGAKLGRPKHAPITEIESVFLSKEVLQEIMAIKPPATKKARFLAVLLTLGLRVWKGSKEERRNKFSNVHSGTAYRKTNPVLVAEAVAEVEQYLAEKSSNKEGK